ncbi:MAG TPA: PAS domain S-box protein [Polyangiaceae bacterium]|jgi:PAS domain S-box-containing protein
MENVSDQQFRILVESIRDYGIFLLDTKGNIVSWNEGARRIKGYEAEEVAGKHFSIFYPRETPAGTWDRQLAIAERDGRFEDYGWRVRKDGTRFWANVVITALRDAAGKLFGYAKVTRDLTERAYRTFVEATNGIVWTTDRNGHPNADSPGWRRFTGQSEEAWRDREAFEPVHADDRARLGEVWDAARRDKKLFEHEFRLRRQDGEYLWMTVRAIPLLDANGDVREWFGVTFDIHARKRAEIELQAALDREQAARLAAEQAQARWTTTLHSIGDAVIATDATGLVTFMNDVAQKLTGWSQDEARGHTLRDVFPIVNEETRRHVEDPVAKVLREGKVVGLANHTVLVRRDGTDVPIDDSAAPIRDDAGQLFGVVLVFRDVTTEKREQARRDFLLRAGEELLSAADYHASLRTVVHLAVPRLADWCAVDVVEPSGEIQRLAVAHVDPSKVTLALELARKYPPNRSDTTGVRNVIRTGQSELYRVIPRELIERSAIDDEHRELLRRLRLHSGMIIPLRGRETVFGAITFVHAESNREYDEGDLAFAEELARRAALVIERRRLADERNVLFEAERRARAQADLANRAKDEFLAVVSHELRNPLSAIIGWAKLLMARDLPPDLREPIQTIERNARAQARLIEDMLDVSRIISGKLQLDVGAANLEQAISDAVESARRAADTKGVAVTATVEPAIEMRADQVRLQQIVANLVTNAVKFTPRGGTVTVTARRRGNDVRIVVHDTGEGIEPHMLEAIFEPFRQVDASTTRRHGGLGLGLAIVRQLVSAHGGAIHAASEGQGKGSTFTVDLPTHVPHRGVFQSAPTSEPPPSPPSPLPRLDRTRVLVVDDQPELVELMAFVLSSAGAEVTSATSAVQALELFARTRPDVIVSDIGMPEVDGYELIRRIRALPPSEGGRTPAIAITAYVRREDAERAFASGFQRHVPKPVEPRAIVVAVANLAGIPLADGR